MVVTGPKSKQAALDMVKQGSVYYSDKYIYSTVVGSVKELDDLLQRVLDRGDIAIVSVTKGGMEFYVTERKKFMMQRHQEELRNMRKFIADHPKAIARIVERNARAEAKLEAIGEE